MQRICRFRPSSQTRRSHALCGLAAAVWMLAACTEDATQLMVLVDSDFEVNNELAEVRATIRASLDEPALWSLDFGLRSDADVSSALFTLPLSFGVAPRSDDPDLPIVLEIAGRAPATEEPIVVRRARTRFVDSQILVLPIFLAQQCRGVVCDAGQTCIDGACVPFDIEEETLETITPSAADDPRSVIDRYFPTATTALRLAPIGDVQRTGVVDQPLVDDLQVALTDAQNRRLAGRSIEWSVLDDGGSVLSASSITDANGVATARVQLGTDAGVYRFQAENSGANTPVVFEVTARPGAPAVISARSGQAQTGFVGAPLSEPLTVSVTDAFANEIEDAVVRWRSLDMGSIDPPQADRAPYAATAVLGPSPGQQRFEATVDALRVEFRATAEASPGVFEIVSGDGQWAPAGQPLRAPLVVRVLDASRQPVSGAPVRFNVVMGGGWVETATATTLDTGLASTGVVLGPELGDVHRIRAVWNGLTVDFTARADERVCGRGGWCFAQPSEGAWKLYDVWVGANVAWAVGDQGFIRQRDATGQWQTVPSGTYSKLQAVWGLDGVGAWAVGYEGAVLRFDGARWRPFGSPTQSDLLGVWARAADEVWAVGGQGRIFRWDGIRWNAESSGISVSIVDIHGPPGGEPWAFASDGTLLRRTNGIWASPASADLGDGYGLWALNDRDVWVASQLNVKSWVVDEWIEPARPSTTENLYQAVYGTSSTDVWAIGGLRAFRWNGSDWTQLPSLSGGHRLTSVHGSGATVIGAGLSGALHRWSGIDWVSEAFADDLRLIDIWSDSTNVALAVPSQATGQVYRWDGSSWQAEVLTPINGFFTSIHGTSASNVWAVGLGGARRFDGQTWRAVDPPLQVNLQGVRVESPTQAWVVGEASLGGDGIVMRWRQAEGWQVMTTTPDALSKIAIDDSANVWVGGAGPTLLQWDGTAWRDRAIAGATGITDIQAVSPTDVWVGVLGSNPGLHRWDGTAWRQEARFSPRDSWSSGPNDVWFLTSTTAYRWNGTSFEEYVHAVTTPFALAGLSDTMLLTGNSGVTVVRERPPGANAGP